MAANPLDTTAIEAAMVALFSTAERVDDLKDRLRKAGPDAQMKRATFHALGQHAQKDSRIEACSGVSEGICHPCVWGG